MSILSFLLAASLSLYTYGQADSIRGYLISGYVVDEQGRPLANMTIRLYRVAMGQYFLAKTDSSGNYSHADLPGRRYEISIIKDGHSFVLSARIGAEDEFIGADNTVQTTIIRPAATVNFDLRALTAPNARQRQKVNVAGLKIPRKSTGRI